MTTELFNACNYNSLHCACSELQYMYIQTAHSTHTVASGLTTICNMNAIISQVQYMDTFGVNFYAGWYEYPGRPDTIPYTLSARLEEWYNATKKPFFMSEYGATAVSGVHKVSLPVTDMLCGSCYMCFCYMCAYLAACTIRCVVSNLLISVYLLLTIPCRTLQLCSLNTTR